MMAEIAANLRRVQQRLADAAARTGREPAEVDLVVVTKTLSLIHI